MFLTHALRAIYRSAVAASDALWEYVTLLLTGSPQTSTFVTDASTNNFQITINGDTRPNNFSPYTTGYYSNFFNGGTSNDLLSFPSSSTAYNLSGGTWTVELWMYPTMSTFLDGDCRMLMAGTNGSSSAWQLFINSSRLIGFGIPLGGSTTLFTGNSVFSFNTWTHVAVVCQAGSTRIYVNGVSSSGPTNITLPASASVGFKIGFDNVPTVSTQYAGYITNVRINTTTAVYTSNFTPSTTPITAISGTSLLTCQSNRFIDNSTNNFAITRNGSTSVSPFDPFVPSNTFRTYGSTYFDGTGDYLSTSVNAAFTFGTGNLTLECWIYQTATSAGTYRVIFADDVYGSAGGYTLYSYNNALNLWKGGSEVIAPAGTIALNVWTHIAWTRSGSANRLFINGAQVGATTTDATNYTGTILHICASQSGTFPFTGYIADVRIVKGTAVYTANFTPPTAPLTAIANTSLLTLQTNQPINNSTFLDNSSLGSFITRNGNATQGSFSPYGGDWSNYFDGTGDYLGIANNAAFNFGTGAFTIECWFMLTADATADQDGGRGATLLCAFPNSGAFSSDWVLGLDGNTTTTGTSISFAARQSGAQQSSVYTSTITKNVWHHVAATRTGNTLSLYYDGVRVAQNTSFTNTVNSGGNLIKIGALLYSANLSGYMNYFPGYISNVRVVTGSVLYTGTTYTVPTTPLTAIANTSLLTCQSNSLIDNSLNRFAITRNGDVSVQPFSPFHPTSVTPVSYGAYFDGTGDYLTTTFTSAGSSDFCIELWAFVNNVSANRYFFSQSNASVTSNADIGFAVLSTTASKVAFYWNFGTTQPSVTSTPSLNLNQWNHVAAVRNGSTFTIYLNGVGTSTTSSGTINVLSSTPKNYIGYFTPEGNSTAMVGYLSNLRLVIGTAVYTSNFTPPTLPLTAVANTSLLTCQSDRFIDNSTNNFAITNNGDARPVTQNPFGSTSTLTTGYDVTTVGGSAYFDGNGDSLQAPSVACISGTGDFTAECWIYPTTAPATYNIIGCSDTLNGLTMFGLNANGTIFYGRSLFNVEGTTSNACQYNAWNHIAISRSSGTVKIFVNGVQGYSATNTYSFVSGIVRFGTDGGGSALPYTGYISNFRIIQNSALYTGPFVPPVAPVTAITNTTFLGNFANAGVIDYSGQGNLETVGDVKLSTSISKFGGTSMYFDGTGDYLTIPHNPVFNFGTGDFTIECWAYFNNLSNSPQIIQKLSSNLGWFFEAGPNTIYFGFGASNASQYYQLTGITLTTGVWYHLAATRVGSVLSIFLNGVKYSSTVTNANASYDNSTPFIVGSYRPTSTAFDLNGYIDDLRITRGVARYTANFTPPTAALPTF